MSQPRRRKQGKAPTRPPALAATKLSRKMRKAAKFQAANNNDPRWHIGFDKFSMGSGDKPKSTKSRNLDMIAMAPMESAEDFGAGSSKNQIISQDEYITTVVGSTVFQSTSYVLQPGLANMFPWLAAIANLFQKYRIISFRFYVKPLVSQYNALGQSGRVILGFDYDATASPLTTQVQAEGMAPHVDGMPYEKMSLALNNQRATPTTKFVRSSVPPAGSDLKMYDAGTLYVSTYGLSGSGTIGELRCKYTVELQNPVLPNSVVAPTNNTVSLARNQLAITIPTATDTLITLDTFDSGINGLGLAFSGGSLVMPAGMFLLNWTIKFNNPGANVITAAQSWITRNGTAVGLTTQFSGATGFQTWTQSGATPFTCAAGDLLAIKANVVFASGTTSVPIAGCHLTLTLP